MQIETNPLTLDDFLADEQVQESGHDSLLHRIAFEVCAGLLYGPHSEPLHDDMLSAALRKRCRQRGIRALNAKRIVLDVMDFLVRSGAAVIPSPEDYKPYLDYLVAREFTDLLAADHVFLSHALHDRFHRDQTVPGDEILWDILEIPRFRTLEPERLGRVISKYMDYLVEMGALALE